MYSCAPVLFVLCTAVLPCCLSYVLWCSRVANKSQQKIAIINADGTGNTTLTTGTKSETDPTWYQGKIAFLSGGQLWTMNADGSDRKQISKTSKDIEGFKFSPDGSKVILLHSIDFNEIIQKNPDDLPKATGRLVTDLMYRHWDHYALFRPEGRDGP